jgi:hypothetical protein
MFNGPARQADGRDFIRAIQGRHAVPGVRWTSGKIDDTRAIRRHRRSAQRTSRFDAVRSIVAT